MNLRDELPIWRYRKVSVNLHLYECITIYESIKQFMKEQLEKKLDFFSENFSSQIRNEDLNVAYIFFHDFNANNSDIKELTRLGEEEKKKNERFSNDSLEISLDSDDPFGMELSSKISDISMKEVNIDIELLTLVTSLRISEAYQNEMNYRKNDEATSRESNDWSPPSNFANGTDDEKEIWEYFQRTQNSRK